MLQETLLAAWRGLARFEERASLRAWLYRIATNRCLNALRASGRRTRVLQPMDDAPEPTRRSEPLWLEPYPDVLLERLPDSAPGPDARYEAKEAIELAFVVALQRLPPRQRAVLVLRDVLGYRAAEVARMLDSSEVAVKGALQRARAAVAERPAGEGPPRPRSPQERELVGRFVALVESDDIDGIVALMTADARLTMPPQPHEYEGHAAIAAFLRDRSIRRGAPLRLVPTRANTQPAFGAYLLRPQDAVAHAYGLLVLTLAGDRIAAITWFADSGVFPRFGLPATP
jgi:RNA polymerase sigma-70 factor (TIGR02960 family)